MNKKIAIIGVLLFLAFMATIAYGAPLYTPMRSVIPETDSAFYLGTTSPSTIAWASVITDQVCLTDDTCRTTWPTGSGAWPFTPTTNYGVAVQATTTPLWFQNGLMASSTTYFLGTTTHYSNIFSLQSASVAPATSSWDSLSTAFTGDDSKMGIGLSGRLTGTSVGTSGNPNSGYNIRPELSRIASYVVNTSGNNESTTSNDGRTGALNIYVKTDNYGQGDATSLFCNNFVLGARSGATSFLANPAVSCLAGQSFAGADGVFIQGIGDLNLNDQSYDVAAVLFSSNFSRSNATGALNANWGGLTLQNPGTLPIDWMERYTGKVRVGTDLTALSYPDYTLVSISLSSGGTSYTVGDVLTAAGGTYDQQTVVRVLTVNGSGTILTFGLDRAGLYSVVPSTPNSFTGGTGSSASFSLQYSTSGNPMLVTGANNCWYANATNDTGVYDTRFSSTLKLGTSWLCYSSSLAAWNFVSGNASVLQLYGTQVIANTDLKVIGKLGVATTTYNFPLTVGGAAWIGGNLTATGTITVDSTTGASILPYASTTAITASGTGYFGNGAFTNTSGTTTVAAGQGFTIGASQFVLEQGSGNIGIGTANPATKVHITLPSDSVTALYVEASDAGALASIFSDGSEDAWFRLYDTSGNEDIRLRANGDSYLTNEVGISTTTPAFPLQIVSDTKPQIVLNGTGVADNWGFRGIGGYLYIATSSKSGTYATSTVSALSISPNGVLTVPNLSAASCDVKASTAGVLSCGTDVGGSGAWPFTPSTYDGVANQSTTTPLWLKDTMVLASTTLFTRASSTDLTVSGTSWLSTVFIGADSIAEYVADTAGAMFTGNTETGITVTYQDADNTTDFVVSNLEDLAGTLDVGSGGTGAATFGQGWIYSSGGTTALAASTSPTVNYVVATSTTIASTFPYASTTQLSATSLCLTGDTCRTTWPTGAAWPFTPSTYGGVANQSTTTPLWLKDTMVLASTTLFTNASTTGLTIAGNTWFPGSGIWNSSGNVGIGTTSPYALLSVATPPGATGSLKNLFVVASSTPSATTTLFSIDNAGQVGIGVAGAFGFSLRANSDIQSLARFIAGNGTAPLPSFMFGNDTDTGLFSATTNALGFTAAGTELARLTTAGFGFGTTTPRWTLTAASSTAPQLALTDASGGDAWTFRNITNTLYISTSSASATSTMPAITITPNSYIGIASSSPYKPFSVVGDSIFQGTTAGTSTLYISSSAAAKGGRIILEDVTGTACTQITSNAGVLTAVVVTCP